MLSKALIGLSMCGFGCALLLFGAGCEDGCVRNSDCPTAFECNDALCVPRNPIDGSVDAHTDNDAGR